jgi:hypothetical protein
VPPEGIPQPEYPAPARMKELVPHCFAMLIARALENEIAMVLEVQNTSDTNAECSKATTGLMKSMFRNACCIPSIFY